MTTDASSSANRKRACKDYKVDLDEDPSREEWVCPLRGLVCDEDGAAVDVGEHNTSSSGSDRSTSATSSSKRTSSGASTRFRKKRKTREEADRPLEKHESPSIATSESANESSDPQVGSQPAPPPVRASTVDPMSGIVFTNWK